MRLDKRLAEIEPNLSRTRAANLVELGQVTVNGKIVKKTSFDVNSDDEIAVVEDYAASLGGLKLAHAIKVWGIEVKNKVCLDVGSSNGGFTDVLLQNGADLVYALDVGACALPDFLKQDSKVVIMERTNARFISPGNFDKPPSLAVIDVSFISLTLIIGAVAECLTQDGEIVALVKPQFECSKKDLSKKGIVLDAKKRDSAVKKVEEYCKTLGLTKVALIAAPHPFAEKNQEYLLYLKNNFSR